MIDEGLDEYNKCELCPRKCGINRYKSIGYCRSEANVRIARAGLHFWEEPCISGEKGSGTVFFTGCNLNCVFCQNKEISKNLKGKDISINRLVEIFFELKSKGANNINIVTGDIFIPSIRLAIEDAKQKKLDIPFILNSSGYVSVDSIKSLEGLIDIYLPDFKYIRSEDSVKYSGVPDYVKVVKSVIEEMVRQQPLVVVDNKSGIMKKGVIVRHLLLPGMVIQAKMIIKYLYEKYGDRIIISLLNQYTPNGELDMYPEINRKIREAEYRSLWHYAMNQGVTQAYIQEKSAANKLFIPKFDLSGV
ncbi:MAG: radical SAM protein [Lachnospiraceae bacterium]|nr:radical SAM protein [Lachnospiraceae bacterium]